MKPLARGRYEVRFAQSEAEVEAAQRLRHKAFLAARGHRRADGRDVDAFDATARHVLVLDTACAEPVACYRVQLFHGTEVAASYAAQFYDLSRLTHFPEPMLEMGRFCLDPSRHDPDILRLAWAAMTRLVDDARVGLLFGCSSFNGADIALHASALAALTGRVAPSMWRPAARAPEQVTLAGLSAATQSAATLPPLLRTYLSMGGWVSDHAVVDRHMDTLHVLTGVEIAAIPAARARALRLLAAS